MCHSAYILFLCFVGFASSRNMYALCSIATLLLFCDREHESISCSHDGVVEDIYVDESNSGTSLLEVEIIYSDSDYSVDIQA